MTKIDKKIETFLTCPNCLNWIYPPICGICGKLSTDFLCNKCKVLLKKEAVFEIENYEKHKRYFEEHLYVFIYEGIVRKAILNYKFNEKAYLYKTFVNFLLNNEKIVGKLKSYDIIIPVPISKKRKMQRGYNQSELIAKEISKVIKLKLINNCLYKIKDNIPQSTLSREERQDNVIEVYGIKNKKILQNKKVILVDDIYTTGSTVNECSRILKQSGAKKVGIFTLAKD